MTERVEREDAPMHIGIMGGTFDPIHLGHLACAQFAVDAAALDEVLFIPAGNPTFKQGRQIACAHDRFEMVQLAIADNERFRASRIEIDRPGVTYTIDTVRQLREMHPSPTLLSFIIGSDAILDLGGWKDIEELAGMIGFICVARPGYTIDEAARERFRALGVRVQTVCAPLLDISSTEIRERVARGRTIRYLTPLSVCALIRQKGLYVPERHHREGACDGT